MSETQRDFLGTLAWRGLLHQTTDEGGLKKHLASGVRRAYVGFDPTADSLTIGNLVPMLLLAHFQRAGHQPVVVAGGGTGLIGDPSGKSSERQLMSREQVAANVESQKKIFARVLDFSSGVSNKATIVDNAGWLCAISFLDALRDIGKHFRVNEMIQRDSVRERLEARDQGISYTEFSYMILQAYDFAHLHMEMGVTLQMGGSDQWGNIIAGCDLIRKSTPADRSHECYGLTAPLVTKADGGKFGKTEKGAIWLSADRTSPYAFYQFWLNAADEDAARWVRLFTMLGAAEADAALAAHSADPGKRELHRLLAHHMTSLLHGPTEADQAKKAGEALFSGDIGGLDARMLDEVFANVPASTQPRASLAAGVGLIDLLVTTGLAQSKREAKEFLASGAVTINGRRVGPDDLLKAEHLLHAGVAAIRRGKKNWHLTRWV
ncbi:MAG: tyrosine--tRNA ligase [Phycisphaerales bacterium]|nr:tyrosine--tRNA ligase [Phycisphaerales bacterium]